MSSTEQERETQTISGTVVGLLTKSEDTWQVAVSPPDSQYNKNLWTKDSVLAGQVPQMIGRQATFFCNVSVWSRDGKETRSLWVDGWTLDGVTQTSGNGGMQTLADPVAQAQAALDAARAAQAAAQADPVAQAEAALAQARAEAAAAQAQPQPQPASAGQQGSAQAWVDKGDLKEIRIMREAADKCGTKILAAMILTGNLPNEELTPQRIHGFLDSFAQRRQLFYETGSSAYDDDVPFAHIEPGEPGIHIDPWRAS